MKDRSKSCSIYFQELSKFSVVNAQREFQEFKKNVVSHFLGISAKKFQIKNHMSGKPYLPDYPQVNLSISHTKNKIVVALSRNMNLGIDIQDKRPFNPKIFQRICCPWELKNYEAEFKSANDIEVFYNLWTAKEALLKCIGTGFSFAMKNTCIDLQTRSVNLLKNPDLNSTLNHNISQNYELIKLDLFANCAGCLVFPKNQINKINYFTKLSRSLEK